MDQVYYYLAIIFAITFVLVGSSHTLALIIRLILKFLLRRQGVEPLHSTGVAKVSFWHRMLTRPGQFIKLGALTLLVTAVTIFICLNTLVLIFKQPLPFIESVQAFPAESTLQQLLKGKNIDPQGANFDALGNNRTFTLLKLPRLNLRLDLLPFMTDKQGDYLFRLNSGHYFFTGNSPGVKPDNLLIYLTKNWRSLLYPDTLQVGDNVFLQKDDGSSVMFKLIDKQVLDFDKSYLPQKTDNLGLILVISDPDNKLNYFFRGNYIDVNNLTVK